MPSPPSASVGFADAFLLSSRSNLFVRPLLWMFFAVVAAAPPGRVLVMGHRATTAVEGDGEDDDEDELREWDKNKGGGSLGDSERTTR